MKKIWGLLCLAIFMALSITTLRAEKATIKMGTMAWEDIKPISLMTKKIMEQQGYKVELTEFSEWGIAYAAVSRGDVDILISQINYMAQDYWNKNKNRLEKISVVSHGVVNAIGVPDYVPIDSIDQLNEYADKFDGKIIGLEPGGGLMRDTANVINTYGLHYTLVEGSTAGMTSALKAAVDRKEWILVTIWDPSWMVSAYKVKFLKDPKGVFPPPQSYYWIGEKGFSEKHPEVRELMAGIYLPLQAITDMNSAVEKGETWDAAVQDWMNENSDIIKRWINIKSY